MRRVSITKRSDKRWHIEAPGCIVNITHSLIDTSGHVEEETIKVLQSTNRAFDGPAKDVIRRSVYRPGRVRGQAVRVLVSQQIGFTIQRDD